ncbi:MAG: hypothetical protein ACRDL6_13080 [Solirubrobacterales bacterium]
MRRAGLLLAAMLTTGLIAAGCGDDDGGDGGNGDEALTKEEFVAQGNQICREGNQELDAIANQSFQREPTPEQEERFVNDEVIPNIQGQIDEIRALESPEGDEETINGILDDAEAALDEIRADPSLIEADPGPFAEVNQQLREYGLSTCGSG